MQVAHPGLANLTMETYMRCTVQLLPSMLLLLFLTACGQQSDTAREGMGAGTPAGRDDGAATAGSTPDTQFLQEQIAAAEKVEGLARLVPERATRPAVREFADRMARDHRQAAAELRQIAGRQQVQPPAGNEQLRTEGGRLSKLSGQEFEREFLDEIIADLEDAVVDLEGGGKTHNPETRQWASKTLPTVRRHLEEARQLRNAPS